MALLVVDVLSVHTIRDDGRPPVPAVHAGITASGSGDNERPGSDRGWLRGRHLVGGPGVPDDEQSREDTGECRHRRREVAGLVPATSCSAAVLSAAAVTEAATLTRTAMPAAAPTCWLVLIRPRPSPWPRTGAPAVVAIVTATRPEPMPRPWTVSPGSMSDVYLRPAENPSEQQDGHGEQHHRAGHDGARSDAGRELGGDGGAGQLQDGVTEGNAAPVSIALYPSTSCMWRDEKAVQNGRLT